MRKKLLQMGIDPITHEPRTNDLSLDASQMLAAAIRNGQFGNNNIFNNNTALEDLLKLQLIHKMLQIITPNAAMPSINRFNINSVNPKPEPVVNSFNTNSVNPKPEPAAGQLNVINPRVFINQTANEDFLPSFDNIWDGSEDNQLPGLVTVSQENINLAKPDTSTTTEVDDQTGAGMMSGYYGDQIPSSGSVSVSPETSGLNHPGNSSGSGVLEDWEKFLDDETSDSCWKSFLE